MNVSKCDIENYPSLRSKSLKDSGKVLPSSRKLEKLIKPLSDVKNIIADKDTDPRQGSEKFKKKTIGSPDVEDGNDELYFYSEYEDNYNDIIPKSYQFQESDIKKIIVVLDRIQSVDIDDNEELERLPELESFELSEDENFVLGRPSLSFLNLESDDLLFDPIEV